MSRKPAYGNDSISMLKGADRVRKRPAVIFGSDNLEGCIHSFFEILSNSIDEAREGYGTKIIVTRGKDGSLTVEDFGRGIPLDYNPKKQRFNWELVYCELYAGGKYDASATQYASEYFDVNVFRDGFKYELHFKKGEPVGELIKEPTRFRRTGTIQHWKPDYEVFTETVIPLDDFKDIIKYQSVVNSGIEFVLKDEVSGEEFTYLYLDGIKGYCAELSGETGLTDPFCFVSEGIGRDAEDRSNYRVKAEVVFCFNNDVNVIEYFHDSNFLEYGGSPDKAVRSAFTNEIDKQIRSRDMYKANEGKIHFQDIQDSLILISNTFSTITLYENNLKKAIKNKFIQDFMTELIRSQLEIWFIENKLVADKVIEQILANKHSRENAEKAYYSERIFR